MKLRSVIFLTVIALGILPLLTLVLFNLPGHIRKHEEDARQALLARAQARQAELDGRIRCLKQSLRQSAAVPGTIGLVAGEAADPVVFEQDHTPLSALMDRWFGPESAVLALGFIDLGGDERFRLERRDGHLQRTGVGRLANLSQTPLFDQGLRLDGQQVLVDFVHGEAGDRDCPEAPHLLSLVTPIADNGGLIVGLARLDIDLSVFLSDFLDSYWLCNRGHSLHRPLASTGSEWGGDLPELGRQMAGNRPFLRAAGQDYISFIPISFNDDGRATLWIGSPMTHGSEAWKRSLLLSIVWVVVLMVVIVFFVANHIAGRTDRIKEDILAGLERIITHEEEVAFDWGGPHELRTLAHDLTAFGRRYALTSRGRREAEEALRESEEKFRNLTASAQDGIVLMDLEGCIAYWNEAAATIFGYSAEEARGRPIHNLIDPRRTDPDSDRSRFRPSDAAPPRAETLELVTLHKDGTEVPVELSLSAASINDAWHAIWIVRDISERKRAEEEARRQQQQLVQADKMISLGLLVSGVAHEINNPNSIAMLNTPMLARAWESVRPILEEYYRANGDFLVAGLEYSEMREQVPRLFGEIEESVKRIRHIVQDLKDYARQDTTRHMEPVDLNEVARAAVRLTYNRINKATRYFVTHYEPGLPPIRGNWHRLEQVVINLLQNACEALPDTEAGITLATSFDPARGTVALRVQDEGVGIAAEVLGQITDPFFTTKRTVGGTGLGLSVSAGIVKEHNGTIRFVSEPGNGTVAVVTFPAFVNS